MSDPEIVILDAYHWHEALDRAHVVECVFEAHICEHPVIMQTPELTALADEIAEKIAGLYQAIGRMEPSDDH